MTNNETAKRIAEETRDAYSRSRYTDSGWVGVAKRLAIEGFTADEIRWVLESKHMRWAGDHASRSHSVTAANFINYALASWTNGFKGLRANAQRELPPPAPKTPSGADLAGACEGEDIAALIDLAAFVAAGKGKPSDWQQAAKNIMFRIQERAK